MGMYFAVADDEIENKRHHTRINKICIYTRIFPPSDFALYLALVHIEVRLGAHDLYEEDSGIGHIPHLAAFHQVV